MNFFKEARYNGLSGIRYYNSGRAVPASELWTTRFLESRGIGGSLLHPVNITSVFGPVSHCRTDRKGLNVFYTGENIHADPFLPYEEYLSRNHFDLVLGFDLEEAPDYLRFPYWLLHKFDPASDQDAVARRVAEIGSAMRKNTDSPARPRFCSLVSRHDRGGQRSGIADALSPLGTIDYGGSFRRSTDELVTRFGDDKTAFLRQYLFNICPENTDAPGYVTEKLFDSFEAGCIPVYWGAGGRPEPEIINHDAILFWDGNAEVLRDRVRELMENRDAYEEFVSRPVFMPGAAEKIWQFFVSLEEAIKSRI